MTKHLNVSRSTLIDTVNYKCVNYCRKAKSSMLSNDDVSIKQQLQELRNV